VFGLTGDGWQCFRLSTPNCFVIACLCSLSPFRALTAAMRACLLTVEDVLLVLLSVEDAQGICYAAPKTEPPGWSRPQVPTLLVHFSRLNESYVNLRPEKKICPKKKQFSVGPISERSTQSDLYEPLAHEA
jgi:hypothetical protein